MEYRVIIKPSRKGVFDYKVAGSPVQGRSQRPLFAACRQLKQIGASPYALAALFHEGSAVWAVRCTVGKGAELADE